MFFTAFSILCVDKCLMAKQYEQKTSPKSYKILTNPGLVQSGFDLLGPEHCEWLVLSMCTWTFQIPIFLVIKNLIPSVVVP